MPMLSIGGFRVKGSGEASGERKLPSMKAWFASSGSSEGSLLLSERPCQRQVAHVGVSKVGKVAQSEYESRATQGAFERAFPPESDGHLSFGF